MCGAEKNLPNRKCQASITGVMPARKPDTVEPSVLLNRKSQASITGVMPARKPDTVESSVPLNKTAVLTDIASIMCKNVIVILLW